MKPALITASACFDKLSLLNIRRAAYKFVYTITFDDINTRSI